MKTRIEAFVEQLALGTDRQDGDGLDAVSRRLNELGDHDLARYVYGLYVEAYMIQKELEHQRAAA